jgi:hypothetical protein
MGIRIFVGSNLKGRNKLAVLGVDGRKCIFRK